MEETIIKIKEFFRRTSLEIYSLMEIASNHPKPLTLIADIKSLIKKLKYDEDYIEDLLPRRVEKLIEGVTNDLPGEFGKKELDEIENTLNNGIKSLAKYIKILRDRMVHLEKQISLLKKTKHPQDQLKLVHTLANNIKTGSVYLSVDDNGEQIEDKLNSLFLKIENLNQLLIGLETEKEKIKRFLELEYKHIV